MADLFTFDEICRITGGAPRNLASGRISSISIDSRSLEPEALFVAIRGERFDGHDFAAQAIENGAAAALVSAERAGGLSHLPLIVVPDALAGLGDLAVAARARSGAQIVAVTGSVGKTTTKEALRTLLSAFGTTHASIKSYNNHWGVPLMLAGLPPEAQFGVFEMGMNHEGEIEPLSRMVRPHIAVITAIAPAHIGLLGSMEAIARAKAEIFAGVEPGGLAIINADHDHLPQLVDAATANGLRTRTYGFAEDADVRISGFTGTSDGSSASVGLTEPVQLSLDAPGRHMISNAAAALLVAEELGLDAERGAHALRAFSAGEGRGRIELLGDPANPLLLIDESYNANPTSMAAALEVFASRQAPSGRKILVLGDMRELGTESEALHHSLKQAILDAGADELFLVGEHFQQVAPELSSHVHISALGSSAEEVRGKLVNSLAAGDAVMLKASLGTGLGVLVTAIRRQFTRDA